jgi:hypothetical protein
MYTGKHLKFKCMYLVTLSINLLFTQHQVVLQLEWTFGKVLSNKTQQNYKAMSVMKRNIKFLFSFSLSTV